MNATLIEYLRSWMRAGAVPKALSAVHFAQHFSYDDGIFRVSPPLAVDHARMGDRGLEQLVVLAEVATSDAYVAVSRGRDDITGMWHQTAWVFTLSDDLIVRLIVTSSPQIPEVPYDGTLPLRESEN
jgi:hypothetical protein